MVPDEWDRELSPPMVIQMFERKTCDTFAITREPVGPTRWFPKHQAGERKRVTKDRTEIKRRRKQRLKNQKR